MGLDGTKPVFGVSYIARLKPFSSATETRYDTFQYANNKGADQTAQSGLHLCCSQIPKIGFLVSRPMEYMTSLSQNLFALKHVDMGESFKIYHEFRILRLTFRRKAASKC